MRTDPPGLVDPGTTGARGLFQVSLLCLAVVVAGFGMNVGLGRVHASDYPWYTHVHVAILCSWMLLSVAQPWLIVRGDRALHRMLGWAGVALIVAVGLSGIVNTMLAVAAGRMRPGAIFMAINLLTVAVFWSLAVAAIVLRRRSAWHARLIASATIMLSGAAWSRILPMEALGPAALFAATGCTLLPAFRGMWLDYRASGRVHPAWFWGVTGVVAVAPAVPLLAFWPPFSAWVASFAPA